MKCNTYYHVIKYVLLFTEMSELTSSDNVVTLQMETVLSDPVMTEQQVSLHYHPPHFLV